MPITVVERAAVPKEISSLLEFRPDYGDTFTAPTSDAATRSAEQWSRAALDEANPIGRFLAWQTVLGLRLESRPSPELVAGWRIAGRTDRWIKLEAVSWFMTANMLFTVDEEEVSFATFVRYDRAIGPFIWGPISKIHRRLAPDVLRGAVKRLR